MQIIGFGPGDPAWLEPQTEEDFKFLEQKWESLEEAISEARKQGLFDSAGKA